MGDVIAAILSILALIVAPVALVRIRGRARWRWFGLGIGSWALALIVKGSIHEGLMAGGLRNLAAGVQGCIGGFVSAATELGAAALFLRKRDLRGADLLAFGVGIGSFEVLFVFGLGLVAEEPATAPVWWAAWLGFFAERALALVGHVASRVLVHVAIRLRQLVPAAIAVATFTAVDGMAEYGAAADWDWSSPGVLAWMLGFLACVGALEAWAAWKFWRRAELRWWIAS